MSVQTARKVALAYWGFSSKASSRAKSGIDIDIVKGNGGPGLESATAPLQRFAKLVADSWEDYTGQIGSHGRIPFETLLDFAIKVKTKEEVIGESDMDEIDKWSKVLINENSHYFIARTTYKKQKMKLLINTKN